MGAQAAEGQGQDLRGCSPQSLGSRTWPSRMRAANSSSSPDFHSPALYFCSKAWQTCGTFNLELVKVPMAELIFLRFMGSSKRPAVRSVCLADYIDSASA